MIFSTSEPALQEALPKFYKKPGRQRTVEKTKEVILYRITRGKWPQGLSEYMCWYYNEHYISKGGKFYARTRQWRNETGKKSKEKSKGNAAEPESNVVSFRRKSGER